MNGDGEPIKVWVKYNNKMTGTKHFSIDELIDGIANAKEEVNGEYQYNCYYLWEDGKYIYDHTQASREPWEPEGEYILIGRGRDGLPQYQVNGTGNTTFIGSVFTFGFLTNPELGGCITYQEIAWREFEYYVKKMNTSDLYRRKDEVYVNFTGHEQTAQILQIPMNRITIRAKPGDKIVWAQYKGPRLEEGSTTVPDGAEFVPMKAEIYNSKMMRVVNQIKDSFIR